MTNYAYMLNTYGEYGPTECRITLDRNKIGILLEQYGDVNFEMVELKKILQEDDEILCDNCHELSDNWGGLQLNVIRLS